MLIDTHCHVDQYKNPLQVVRDCERNDVLTIGVTNLPSHYLIGKQYVSDSQFFKLAIGFHPMAIDKIQYTNELRQFRTHVSHCDYIGEIGLDFSKKPVNNHDIQIEVFTEILRSIGHEKRFVTIHSRGAETETLKVLTEECHYPTVFHWYSGAISLVDQIISKGHFFRLTRKCYNPIKEECFCQRFQETEF